MNIKVLGSGCANCHRLYEMTKKTVASMKLEATVEYVAGDKGIQAIVALGLMHSPVLVVNGKPVMTGFTPDMEKIKNAIESGINK